MTLNWTPMPDKIDTSLPPYDGEPYLFLRDIWPGTESGRAESYEVFNTYVASWWPGENNGEGAFICYMSMIQEPEMPIDPTHYFDLRSITLPIHS